MRVAFLFFSICRLIVLFPPAFFGCLFATPVTFLSNVYGMVSFLWLVLFCGGAVLPACSGDFLVLAFSSVWWLVISMRLSMWLSMCLSVSLSMCLPASPLLNPSPHSPHPTPPHHHSVGIIVSIVPRRHRPVSSSLSLVVFNLLGYFFSLVLSGYLMQARTVLTVD